MYNLLVHGMTGTWDEAATLIPHDRFITYTHEALVERYRDQSDAVLAELMKLPALFAYEFGDDLTARAGWIREVTRRADGLALRVEFSPDFAPIPALELRELHDALDFVRPLEAYNTHWAVKEVDLFAVLEAYQNAPQGGEPADHNAAMEEVRAATEAVPAVAPPAVFIVHGRDEAVKNAVARWIERMGLEAIILSEQVNQDRTVIEKFREEAARAHYAVVLLTPDDLGGLVGEGQSARARQNVIFEMGYFSASLPGRVSALVAADIEMPSDYAGVVYVPYDVNEGWTLRLARELAAAGVPIDPKRLL